MIDAITVLFVALLVEEEIEIGILRGLIKITMVLMTASAIILFGSVAAACKNRSDIRTWETRHPPDHSNSFWHSRGNGYSGRTHQRSGRKFSKCCIIC